MLSAMKARLPTTASVAVRSAIVVICAAFGVLGVIGCLLAALFELQGFGTPLDGDARAGYLLALSAGLVISVSAPLVVWRLLLPEHAPAVAIIIAATTATALLAIAVLGIAT